MTQTLINKLLAHLDSEIQTKRHQLVECLQRSASVSALASDSTLEERRKTTLKLNEIAMEVDRIKEGSDSLEKLKKDYLAIIRGECV